MSEAVIGGAAFGFSLSTIHCACGAAECVAFNPGADGAPIAGQCARCLITQTGATMARKKQSPMESEPEFVDEVGGAESVDQVEAGEPQITGGAGIGSVVLPLVEAAVSLAEAVGKPAKKRAPRVASDDEYDLEHLDIAAETLTGDLRDLVLDTLRHEQDKRPWNKRSESDQRDTVRRVEEAVTAWVRKAIETIAGEGKRSITATLDSVTVKDGIKATLTMSRVDPNRYGLMDATGHTVLLMVADVEEFSGERKPAPIMPDQASLLGEKAMAQHSSANGAEAPFH